MAKEQVELYFEIFWGLKENIFDSFYLFKVWGQERQAPTGLSRLSG